MSETKVEMRTAEEEEKFIKKIDNHNISKLYCDEKSFKNIPQYGFLALQFKINSNPTWNKNYLTWSLVNGTNYSFLDDVIEMWNIEPLEFARVDPGKGDINIYFKTVTNEHVMGYAHYPEEGKVFIK
ncbi:hypothetical protein CDAR_232051 [Caerostris darwini]|uniref:Uncharacterized protein n=1 Tax=Caerostris darwini TaxID=1538125 RepID=A0AAV4P776_9ARAC|nr:hypothetical protein CDAR_232051 [Caerostris darwini]